MMEEIAGTEDVIETLRSVEERLRDLAYESLRAVVEDEDEAGHKAAAAQEKRLQKARRGVERAIVALGGEPSD
jgi:hypothetical protein